MADHNDDTPQGPEPANLKFLRILVTTLTATMIIGIAVIVVLMVMRLNAPGAMAISAAEFTLPDSVTALAVTRTDAEVLIVGSDDILYIFTPDTGDLVRTVPFR